MSEGLSRLTLAPYTPFACRVFGCLRCVAWMEAQPSGLGLGFCDEHKTRHTTIPIAVYGRQHEGWEQWPESLVEYLLREPARRATQTRSMRSSHDTCCADSNASSPPCAH